MRIAQCIAARVVALVAVVGAFALAPACGTDAVGIGACREVETARCTHAAACGVDLSHPVHSDGTEGDVESCIRFYHEQCLHGLVSSKEPGAIAVKACIDAIASGDCAVVKQPETSAACAWLIPPATVDAAVVDSATADAAAE
jgi:hypothetical protein